MCWIGISILIRLVTLVQSLCEDTREEAARRKGIEEGGCADEGSGLEIKIICFASYPELSAWWLDEEV